MSKTEGCSMPPSLSTAAPFDWRSHLPVHPAADLFPLLSEAELKELAHDIRENGLKSSVILWRDREDGHDYLLDGRNRLELWP